MGVRNRLQNTLSDGIFSLEGTTQQPAASDSNGCSELVAERRQRGNSNWIDWSLVINPMRPLVSHNSIYGRLTRNSATFLAEQHKEWHLGPLTIFSSMLQHHNRLEMISIHILLRMRSVSNCSTWVMGAHCIGRFYLLATMRRKASRNIFIAALSRI